MVKLVKEQDALLNEQSRLQKQEIPESELKSYIDEAMNELGKSRSKLSS